MEKKKIRVFLADDHHMFRAGMRSLLESEFPVEVVAEAANGKEVIDQLKDLQVDVMLLDVDMPEVSGLELMDVLARKYAYIPVLVLSSHSDEQYIHYMMTKGAKGYILKNCRKNELIMAIKTVSSGNSYLSQTVSEVLFDVANKVKQEGKNTSDPTLTKREREILRLVAQGLTNQEIGQQLFISPRTVDTHRRNMMTKLDLHNAAGLTRYAAKKGLL